MIKKIIVFSFIVFASASVFAQAAKDQVVDGFYERKLYKDKGVIPYENVREADVFYEKRIWRVIDVREKMNQHFVYPVEPFISILLKATQSGEITAYNPLDDQFTTPMTPDEVKQIGGGTDTTYVTDPVTFEEKMEVVQKELDLKLIKKFRIKEDWFFDKESSTMQVRIIGIAPVREKYDDNGNYLGDLVMFWIYYPHIREILAHHESFNRFNDAMRLTWYDVLEMRFFSSYIIKESNALDRRIKDYKTGVDGLLEADRIKMDLFKFEHDLWTY